MKPGLWFLPISGLIILSAAARAETGRTAVFEPVNYPQDINLTDVFFVNGDVGWVSGEHATILNTVDGGKTWNAQVGGETGNNDRAIRALRFVDATHGWAVLGDSPERVLRTDDGQTWNQIGVFDAGTTVVDYAFTSLQHGIALGSNGSTFYISNDGGRHWERRGPCRLRATVQGLARTEECRFRKLQAVSAATAYALVEWSGGLGFLRTDDGGEHWASIVPEVSDCCSPDFFFTGPDTGTLYFNNGKTWVTGDGAKSWRSLLSGGVGLKSGGRVPPVRFADPEVGWVLGKSPDNSDTYRVSFTVDGGQHWKMSRNIAFPAEWGSELNFSLPSRDRAYVVGRHGMIYRYRIVTTGEHTPNALAAPAMPAVDASSLSARAVRVRKDVQTLQAQIAAAASSPPAQPGAAPAAGNADSTDPGATQSQPQAPSTDPSASNADVAATGGATDSGATPSAQNAEVSSAPPTALACCARAVQTLEAGVSELSQNAAQVTTRFRSLNLVIAGLQAITNLIGVSDNLKASVLALRQARSPKTAADALQQLAAATDSAEQAVTTALQNPGAPPASTSGADPQQTSGAEPAPADTASSPQPESGQAPPAAKPSSSSQEQ